jgi:hypothetical protein
MADEITSGYTKALNRARAGVKSIIPIDIDNLQSIVVDPTSRLVTALTTRHTCYRFTPDVNSASFTQTPTGARENGSYNVVQTGLFMMKDNLSSTDLHINNLIKGYYYVIVEYQDGTTKFFGELNGMTITTAEMTSGQAGADLNGTTLNFEGDENQTAPHIDDALLITGILSSSSES